MGHRRTITQPRRATALLAYIILVPMALALFLFAQTRLVMALMETRREQTRLQARLLAESALTRARAEGGGAVQGSIAGAGDYAFEPAAAGGAAAEFVARGIATDARQRVEARLSGRAPAPAALQLTSLVYQVSAVQPAPAPPTESPMAPGPLSRELDPAEPPQ